MELGDGIGVAEARGGADRNSRSGLDRAFHAHRMPDQIDEHSASLRAPDALRVGQSFAAPAVASAFDGAFEHRRISRIGPQRELKFATKGYWRGEVSEPELLGPRSASGSDNWRFMQQAGIDLIPSNDFSLYDQVLDAIAWSAPCRTGTDMAEARWASTRYFAMARGRQEGDVDVTAMEMTKWFDTNYHYIVPELGPETSFSLSSTKPFDEHAEAMEELGIDTVPVIVGPVPSCCSASPRRGARGLRPPGPARAAARGLRRGDRAPRRAGRDWVQLDEPCFVEDRSERELDALRLAYEELGKVHERTRICVKTYFDHVGAAYGVLRDLPIEGVGSTSIEEAPTSTGTWSARAPRTSS